MAHRIRKGAVNIALTVLAGLVGGAIVVLYTRLPFYVQIPTALVLGAAGLWISRDTWRAAK